MFKGLLISLLFAFSLTACASYEPEKEFALGLCLTTNQFNQRHITNLQPEVQKFLETKKLKMWQSPSVQFVGASDTETHPGFWMAIVSYFDQCKR